MGLSQQQDSAMLSDRTLNRVLVQANHVLYSQKVLDGFGHVSVRSTESPDIFFLSRNLAPALVKIEDIQTFNMDGETTDSRKPYLERYIHAAIYNARPDVNAVVHSHSLSVVPYSTIQRPLRPLMHMAGFLTQSVPVYEIRDHYGEETDLLIRSIEQGQTLAQTLGNNSVSLMRGHGYVAVGESLEEAVFNSIYTERNAQVQAQAEQLGDPRFLTTEEANAIAVTNRGQIQRAWDAWIGEINTNY